MEEKVLTEETIKNKDTLQSTKINLGKKVNLPWLLIALIFILAITFTVINYVGYNKGQKAAIELTLSTFEAAGIKNEFAEYEGNNKMLAEEMYDWFNLEGYSYNYNGVYISNSDVVTARFKADYALADLLGEMGYECYRGSDYLEYTNIISYTFNENDFAKILYIVDASLIVLELAFVFWYSCNRKNSIQICDGRLTCKKGDKIIKEFMLSDISSVESASLKGLKIKGNNIKYKINLLANSEELKNYLMENIAKYKKESPVVSTITNQSSNADELKKYKDLFDAGVITQEEFDEKKKQLLGL